MTPEEREELFRRCLPKREDVDPQRRARTEGIQQRMREKIERGELLKSWSKDDFPIGLDSNMQPFPLTGSDQDPEQGRGDQTQQ